MKTSVKLRLWTLATFLASAVACNVILGNESGEFGAVGADASDAPDGSFTAEGGSSGFQPNLDRRCVDPKGGGWGGCLGGSSCLVPGSLETQLGTNTFTRIHSTPAGLVAFGAGQRFLVRDEEGLVRQLDFPNALDLTADRDFVYQLSRERGEDGATVFEVGRVRNGTTAVERFQRDSLIGALAIASPGELPIFTAIGPGILFANIRRAVEGVTLVHLVIRWDEQQIVAPVRDPVLASDPGEFATRFDAYALARVQPDPTNSGTVVQALRRQPPGPELIPLQGAEWRQIEPNDAPDAAITGDGFVETYQLPHVGISCNDTFVMSARWGHAGIGHAPVLASFGASPASRFDLDVLVTESVVVPYKYWGGVARWSMAVDENAVYLARSGAVYPGTEPAAGGNGPGEIYVLSHQLMVLARFGGAEGEQINQLTVTDCYLYWLDGAGRLRRLLKPGSSCATAADR